MRILSNISAIPRSIDERLRRLLASADAVTAFNVRSKRPTAANSAPSDDEGGRETGSAMGIVFGCHDSCVLIQKIEMRALECD